MPEYLAPGVYVEEISTGPKPIEGVSTSVTGFAGITERGPEDARYITSWLQFQRIYGEHLPVETTYMIHAVQGFFDNGGQRCYVARIVPESASLATGALGNLTVWAIGRGDWGNRIFMRVLPATQARNGVPKAEAEGWVRIQFLYYKVAPPLPLVDPFDRAQLQNPNRREPDVAEDYDNLSPIPGAANYLVTTINQGSQLVRAEPNKIPQGIQPFEFVAFTGGTPAPTVKPTLEDYQGDLQPIGGVQFNDTLLLGQGRGLAALGAINDVSLLLIPDQPGDDDLTNLAVNHCELFKDRFGILSMEKGATTDRPNLRPDRDTHYAGQYYPWIWVYDPVTRDDIAIPPSGHVAGIIARTDLDQGVHKPPANAIVRGAKDLFRRVTKADSAVLNPVGINAIRDFRPEGRGIRLWGARTMTSDPEWKYVNVRRLFLFVEQSIDRGTQWVVFEPNSDPTWARVVRTITSFLVTVWRSGALMGTTQDEAFFVKCDRTTMTQDDIDNGRLICYIGIAPVKPAEFVIFRIGQKTADAES